MSKNKKLRMKRNMLKQSAAVILALAALAPSLGAAQTSDYPNQPIKIIIGFAPGTTTDILTRVVGDELSNRLGQPVVVENMPGAASRSEEHTSELQSLMRISYAVFCLKKKTTQL